MNAEQVLDHLSDVKTTSKGWKALCPAHPDKNPSLSIKSGDDAVLLKCWAGCTITDICVALGLHVRDLFYDAGHKQGTVCRVAAPPRLDRQAIAFRLQCHSDMLWHRATTLLDSARHFHCENWTDDEFESAVAAVGTAYLDLERADVLSDVACSVRQRALHEWRTHESRR